MRSFGELGSTRKHSNTLHGGIVGSRRGSASATGYSALYYLGQLSYDDASAPETEGRFSKFTTDINHIQHLGSVFDLHLNFHGQLASRDFDGSEQFSLGEPTEYVLTLREKPAVTAVIRPRPSCGILPRAIFKSCCFYRLGRSGPG